MPSESLLKNISIGIGVSVVAWNFLIKPLCCSPKKKTMHLYHSFPYRSTRCAWLVEELGISEEVEFHPVAIHSGPPEEMERYRETVNPMGTVPTLRLVHGPTLIESGAILMYLADIFQDKGYAPTDSEKAAYYSWILFAASTMDAVLEPLYMGLTHTPKEHQDQRQLKHLEQKFIQICGVLNSQLAKTTYICGNRFTAADCIIGYNVWWASLIEEGRLFMNFPSIQRYLQQIQTRPSFVKVFAYPPK